MQRSLPENGQTQARSAPPRHTSMSISTRQWSLGSQSAGPLTALARTRLANELPRGGLGSLPAVVVDRYAPTAGGQFARPGVSLARIRVLRPDELEPRASARSKTVWYLAP